ncbi:MAG: adenylyltransferase/cytidyltransferase family protein [Acidimicrobiia bacterium]
MIVSSAELGSLIGRVTMVDGSFDPLHDGHVAYFRAAREIGHPVLCNVTTDAWTAAKHPVLLPAERRAAVLDAVRWIDYVHVADGPTVEVLGALRPLVYAKGNDWLARGGVPEEEREACARLGIEVRYLDTVRNSSSAVLADFARRSRP